MMWKWNELYIKKENLDSLTSYNLLKKKSSDINCSNFTGITKFVTPVVKKKKGKNNEIEFFLLK